MEPMLALGWYYNVGCSNICQPFLMIGWFANIGKPPPTLATIANVGPRSVCYLGCSSIFPNQRYVATVKKSCSLRWYCFRGKQIALPLKRYHFKEHNFMTIAILLLRGNILLHTVHSRYNTTCKECCIKQPVFTCNTGPSKLCEDYLH